jgi:hypothetical protein
MSSKFEDSPRQTEINRRLETNLITPSSRPLVFCEIQTRELFMR